MLREVHKDAVVIIPQRLVEFWLRGDVIVHKGAVVLTVPDTTSAQEIADLYKEVRDGSQR